VGNLQVLALELHQARVEGRRVLAFYAGADGPVFLLLEGLNFPLALDDQAQGHGLDTPRRDSPLHLVPKQRAYLVAHQTVQNAPSLLRVHQLGVNLSRDLESFADGVASDLVEEYAKEFSLLAVQQLAQVGADGF